MNFRKVLLVVFVLFGLIFHIDPQLIHTNCNAMLNTLSPTLIAQEDEPVIGIVQIGSAASQGETIFLFGFLSNIVAFNYDNDGILWNKSFGLESPGVVFIWNVIPNSIQQEEVSGVYVSLSNGTIFEVSQTGEVLWVQSLGISAISSLDLVESPKTVEVPFYIISGGDNNQVTWLMPNGSVIDSYPTSSEITLISVKDSYSIVGTRSGSISIYNSTTLLWNKSIGNNQVLASNLHMNLVTAYCYGEEVIFLNLTSGSIERTKDFGVLTYNSIRTSKSEDDRAFLFKNNGDLVVIRVSNGLIDWENNDILSYVTDIRFLEFTGDSQEDIVVSTISGHIYVLNKSTGQTLFSEKVNQEEISHFIKSNLNNDAIIDLIIGTLDGRILVIEGSDLTPPIISELKSTQLSSNKYNITVTTDELVRADIKYGLRTVEEITEINDTYRYNHSFIMDNLAPEVTYLVQIVVYDRNNNTSMSEVISLNTGAYPTSFPFVEIFLGAFIVFGVIGMGYLLYDRRARQSALRYGEEALKYNEYTNAIRYFYKAKARDRIIDVAKILVLNPELAHEMSEIKKIKELEEYIIDAQEIVKQTKETTGDST
ncbi:MAG: hypothetical protein ACFFDC_04155 [Promethearchaeota archaeon]